MSIARPIVIVSLFGILAGGTLAGCGQKGPLVQPDAVPRHKKIEMPKAPPAAPASPAPTDPQR